MLPLPSLRSPSAASRADMTPGQDVYRSLVSALGGGDNREVLVEAERYVLALGGQDD